MLNANAKLWVEALRSGKYRQGERVLQDVETGATCVLGVACLVAIEAGVPVAVSRDPEFIRFDDEVAVVPDSVQLWLRLTECDGEYREDGERTTLYELNDSGKTFAEIADVIESEPPGLFVEGGVT